MKNKMILIKYLSKIQLIYNFLYLNYEFTNIFKQIKYAGGKTGINTIGELVKDRLIIGKYNMINLGTLTKNKNSKEILNKEEVSYREELGKLVKDDLSIRDIYKSEAPNLNNKYIISIEENKKNSNINLDDYKITIENSFRDIMHIFKYNGLRGSQKHEYDEIIQIIALQDALKDSGFLYYYPMGDQNKNAPDLLYETTYNNKIIQIPIQLKSLNKFINERKIDNLNKNYYNTDIIFLSVKEWLISEQILKLKFIDSSKLDKFIFMSINEETISRNLDNINKLIKIFAENNLENPQAINKYLIESNSSLKQVKPISTKNFKKQMEIWNLKYNIKYDNNCNLYNMDENYLLKENKVIVDDIIIIDNNKNINNIASNELLAQKLLAVNIFKTQFIRMQSNEWVYLENPASLSKSLIKKDLYFIENNIPNTPYLRLIDSLVNKNNNV